MDRAEDEREGLPFGRHLSLPGVWITPVVCEEGGGSAERVGNLKFT